MQESDILQTPSCFQKTRRKKGGTPPPDTRDNGDYDDDDYNILKGRVPNQNVDSEGTEC